MLQTVYCPKCGKSISVDDQRTEMFCCYCGIRFIIPHSDNPRTNTPNYCSKCGRRLSHDNEDDVKYSCCESCRKENKSESVSDKVTDAVVIGGFIIFATAMAAVAISDVIDKATDFLIEANNIGKDDENDEENGYFDYYRDDDDSDDEEDENNENW